MPMREQQMARVNDYAVLPRTLAEVVIRKHGFVLGVEDEALLLISRTGENRHDHHAAFMLVWRARRYLNDKRSVSAFADIGKLNHVFQTRIPHVTRELIVRIHDED